MEVFKVLYSSFKDMFLLLAGRIIAKALAFIFVLILAREFSTSIVGQMSLLLVLASGAALITNAGVPSYFLKIISTANTDVEMRNIHINGTLAVLGLGMLLLTLLLIARAMGGFQSFTAEVISCVNFALVLFLPYGLIQLNLSTLRALSKDRGVILTDIGLSIFPIFFLAIMLIFFPNSIGFDIRFIILLSYFLMLIVSSYLVSISIGFSFNIKINFKEIFSLIRASRSFFIASLSMFFNGYISVLLVYSLLGSAHLGVYYIITSLSGVSLIFLTVVNSWIAPRFAKAYKEGDFKLLESLSRRANSLGFLLSLPVFMFLTFFGENILSLYKIDSPENFTILLIMIFFQAINMYFCSIGYLLAMSGNDRFYSNVIIISALIDGVLSLILIPYLGLVGAVIAGGLALAFWNISCFFKCQQVFGFSAVWYPDNLFTK